jgi:hypothetical protein
MINPSLRTSKVSIKSRVTAKSQRYLANVSSLDSDGDDDYDSEDDGLFVEDEDREIQKEVESIIQSVMKLDLGDAKSNKGLKDEMNRYKEENINITNQLSHRSKRSHKSYRSVISRKTLGPRQES